MKQQLIEYVHSLFAGVEDTDEMQQEILQNTLDRYDDLLGQGKSPEAAYCLAIDGIGDLTEIMAPRPSTDAPPSPEKHSPPTNRNKLLRGIAIAMYICCVIPVILLSEVGMDLLGVCLMFIMIAIATLLIVFASGSDAQKEAPAAPPKTKLPRLPRILIDSLALIVYLSISFLTGAWHITWLVFPISASVKGLIHACMDWKGAQK